MGGEKGSGASAGESAALSGVHAAGGFAAGVMDLWRGAAFLVGHPRLWFWAAIPFILNIILFVAVAWGGWHYFSQWLDTLFSTSAETWWGVALGWLLRILFWLVLGLLILFCYVPLATVVAAPFNDIISDQVERMYARAGIDEAFSVRQLGRSIWLGFRTSLKLASKTIVYMLLVLPLYLLPPPLGGILGPAAQAAITIRFLSLEHTSYSMDRRYYTYEQRSSFLKLNRARTIGLGAMCFVVMMVPFVNALFIPIAAVAGTLLFCDTELRRGA
jgi:CysZ protein